MILQQFKKNNLINPPSFLISNTQYLTMIGSVSYGVSTDSSDIDIYGFCIPPKDIIFPHLAGEIFGFGRQAKRFDQWQQHHVMYENKPYDFTIFSIVKYFQLLMENNPNILDSLFVPNFAILFVTEVGTMIRENRHIFLHKGAWFKFKGYAFSQMHKIKTKKPIGKRLEYLTEDEKLDLKFCYNVVRLMDECEQLLVEGDLDLIRNREKLKAIRRGEWKYADIEQYFHEKERLLEKLYVESKLQHSPDEEKIKQLLLNCLEHHYGSLDKAIIVPDKYKNALNQIKEIVDTL
jgi:predicted nucleotidyltransferase